MKKIEVSELEARLLDAYEELRAIARLRREYHSLYEEDMKNGTMNYYIISETLTDLERKFWDEINGGDDKEDEE